MTNHLICITSYGRLEMTLMCLDNLYRNTITPFDLVIVDNCSGKETTDRIEDFISGLANVTLIKNKENVGVAKALNQALKHREPHQTFTKLDNDIMVFGKNTWLKDNLNIFNEVPKIGLIMGNPYDLGITCPIVEGNDKYSAHLKDGTCGAFATYSPAILNKLGKFNEEYGVYGYEDSDYFRQMQALDYAAVFSLTIECAHIDRVHDQKYQDWKQSLIPNSTAKYFANVRKYFEEGRK